MLTYKLDVYGTALTAFAASAKERSTPWVQWHAEQFLNLPNAIGSTKVATKVATKFPTKFPTKVATKEGETEVQSRVELAAEMSKLQCRLAATSNRIHRLVASFRSVGLQ